MAASLKYTYPLLLLCLICFCTFCHVDGSEVSAKTNNYGFDYVMNELMKQRLENAELKRQLETRLATLESAHKIAVSKQTADVEELRQAQTSRGSSYIRWGRTTCAEDSTVLYKGYAAGAKYTDQGAGSSVLCLHDQPQWSRYIAGVHGSDSTIYGVEYRMWEGATNVFSYANNGGQQIALHPAPCAVCYASARLTTVMIPARTECPTGWTKEYQGYIVAGYPTHHRTDYVCWDQAPETAAGASDQAQSYIYPVDVLCGILPCSKYPTGMELTCVVCSK